MIGGLFGLTLLPALFLHGLILACRAILPYFPPLSLVYGSLVVSYAFTCLIWSKDAKSPLPKGFVRRPMNWIDKRSHSFWLTHFDYFPMKLVMMGENGKAELDTETQYVFGCHPHGIHCWPLNMLSFPDSPLDKVLPLISRGQMTGLAASVIFHIPVVRELFLTMGYVDAARQVANEVLMQGRNIFVCTGGEEESMRTVVGKDCVILNKRKGFVRLAISHGASLVPVFGMGNSDLYQTYNFLIGFRMWLQKKTGVALPIFHGRFWSPLPFQEEISIVIGTPIAIDPKHIPTEKGDRPDDKIVDVYHAMYIDATKTLHQKHGKGRYLEIK